MIRILVFLLLITKICFSQSDKIENLIALSKFVGDSITKSPNTDFNKKIKLAQIEHSTATFEIRLYESYALSNAKNLRRIFTVDTTWRAVEYDQRSKQENANKYNLQSKLSFDSLLERLLFYNILSLPTQASLKDKMHKDVQVDEDGNLTERKIIVTDGVGYTVELKVGKKFRVYQFHNPESYSKFYDDVTELKDCVHIVELFKNLLERN